MKIERSDYESAKRNLQTFSNLNVMLYEIQKAKTKDEYLQLLHSCLTALDFFFKYEFSKYEIPGGQIETIMKYEDLKNKFHNFMEDTEALVEKSNDIEKKT